MEYKIGNFENFLNEGEHEEEFKARLFKALKDAKLKHTVESSPAQLKNGTIVLRIHDLDLLKKALRDRGIDENDIASKADLAQAYDQWEHPEINKRTDRDTGLSKYTVYSRGGIRVLSGSSDAYKFDAKTETGIKGAVDWLTNHYSTWFIQSMTNLLKLDKFTTYKKGYSLDLSKVSKYMNPVTLEFLERLKTDSPKKFEELSPNIMVLCYLANEEDDLVKITTGSNQSRMDFAVGNVTFYVTQDWTVGIKNPTVKVTIKKTWYYRENRISFDTPTATTLANKANFPDYQQLVISKLVKAPDYDFESLDIKFSGAKAGHNYGI